MSRFIGIWAFVALACLAIFKAPRATAAAEPADDWARSDIAIAEGAEWVEVNGNRAMALIADWRAHRNDTATAAGTAPNATVTETPVKSGFKVDLPAANVK